MIAPTPKRRWYQYRLRSLLVFVLLASIGMSWFAVRMRRAKRQKEAVEAIVKAGGTVWHDYQVDESGNPLPNATPPGPAWLRTFLGDDFFSSAVYVYYVASATDCDLVDLKELTQVRWLYLWGTKVTDAGLEHLTGLRQLRRLGLGSSRVTNAGLKHLMGLTQLQALSLGTTEVTDAGLKHLRGLAQLQELDLMRTQVTDAGMEHIKGLGQLQALWLNDTQVTDAGLEHLQGVAQLRLLNLNVTHVTDTGVKKLQVALPNCKIIR